MKKLLVLLLLSLCTRATAQHEEGSFFMLKGSIHQGWRTMGEVSVGAIDYGRKSLAGSYGYIGTEFNFNTQRFLLGPKVGYDRWILFVVGGVNLTYYTDFDKGTLYLNPHIGSFIYFGYNIPLMRNHMKSRVNTYTFTFIIPLGLGNRLK